MKLGAHKDSRLAIIDSSTLKKGESMNGREPSISPSARIARNATVVGDVEIGANATILFNATLRGDLNRKIIIGDRTNVQELACIHVPMDADTIIGDDVSVGHGAILHGCTIGNGSLIGMGAIVLDGARIGERCLVGAGALVTGKADIPDGMLVIGSPAKAVRSLSDEELKSLADNAAEYVRIGKDLTEQGLLKEGYAANSATFMQEQ